MNFRVAGVGRRVVSDWISDSDAARFLTAYVAGA